MLMQKNSLSKADGHRNRALSDQNEANDAQNRSYWVTRGSRYENAGGQLK